jgi:hypothetical protein
MATVVKEYVGAGTVEPGQSTWWSWKITSGDVWLFWAQPNWYSQAWPYEGAFEIAEVHSRVKEDGSRWARFRIVNVGDQYGAQSNSRLGRSDYVRR